jgi:hypothetical protein
VIKEDFMTNKLHAMVHYTEWVRQKGTLSQFSINRTEVLHRIFKSLYRASNKGYEAEKTIYENEWRSIGMLIFNEELRLEAKKELGGRDLDGDGLESNVEIDEDEVGDGEDKRGYDRLYQWEILLGDEPLFEYLGPEDQLEQELAERRERELYVIEG